MTIVTVVHNLPSNSLESLWRDHSAFSFLGRVNGANKVGGQHRGSPNLRSQRSSTSLATSNADFVGQSSQSQLRARTLQETETEMLLNAQRQRQEKEREELLQQELEHQRLARQQHFRQQQLLEEQLLLQQQDRLREQEIVRQRMLYQQDQLQLQRLLQQQRELQQQRTPPPRMLPKSQSPRFIEQQQRQILLLQHYEEQQRRLHLEEQLRRDELERQMLAMNIERGSPVYNGNRIQGHTPAQIHEARLLQQAYERQLQLQQQQRRQSSRSPAIANPPQHSASVQDRHTRDTAMQQKLLAELVAHGDLAADIHGVSKADQEALRAEAMRKIVEAEKMEEKRRRKAAKIAHMVRATVLPFAN